MDENFLHKNLKRLRELNDLKQSDMDAYLKTSKGVYSTYEKSTTPKLKILIAILKLFRNSVSIELTVELLYEEDLTQLTDKELIKNENENLTQVDDTQSRLVDFLDSNNSNIALTASELELLRIPGMMELIAKEYVKQKLKIL